MIAGYLVVMGGLVLCARKGWLPEGGFLGLDLVLSLTVLVAPVTLDAQLGRAGITDDRLTVRTLTGQRTLDLTSLRRVWLFEIPSRSVHGTDLLFVTDGRRVHVALTSAAALAAVARSVTPRTWVSRHARRRLKPEPITIWRSVVMIVEGLLSYVVLAAALIVLMTVAYGLAFP